MIVTKEMGVIPAGTTITTGSPVFLDAEAAPFRLDGFCEPYRRVPKEVADKTSEAVQSLSACSAGGRLSFRTDSDYLVVHAKLNHLPGGYPTDPCGFDLYIHENGKYRLRGVFCASQGEGKNYVESRLRVSESMKEIQLVFPLFADVSELYIALREGCSLEAPHIIYEEKPLLFYGSSIVHGVGASRPSSNYPAIIGRRLGMNYINLGFSGAAKAEPAIIDYIASLDISAFVYDYDHNAPTPAYLRETHYAGYQRFRAVQPETPIILASRPDFFNGNVTENEERRAIIKETYRRGIEAGDTHLWFLDGERFYTNEDRDESSIDGCHPNDIGYLAMAKTFGAVLEEAIGRKKH